jgi:hypothetical protein
MGERPTGARLKRMSRELAGHARDKDRERRRRKLRGEAPPRKKRKPAPEASDEDFGDWQDDGGGD